jgi:hypothetical protein
MSDEPRKMTNREVRKEYARMNTPYFTRLGDRLRVFMFKVTIAGLALVVIILLAKNGGPQ